MAFVATDLFERVESAADRTIKMVLALPRNVAAQEIGRQIIRSACSVGANLEEARAVLTRKDYTHKVSLGLREARETLYWMRRIGRNALLPEKRLQPLSIEWNELVSILTAMQKKLRSRG